jgi:cobalt/nickel transport protein
MLSPGKKILPAVLLLWTAPAWAHFQTLLPSTDIVGPETGPAITLDIAFTHPMEWGPVMEMGKPVQFGVLGNGRKKDLRPLLKKGQREGKSVYSASYTFQQPTDSIFYIEPAPYWEPAERKMIIHYSKVVVSAFGAGEGWDAAVGLPVEIIPLSRPYGLWTGNLFRGIVTRNGKPVPFAEIEVEYYNKNRRVKIPADPYVTQIIRADSNGVFAYAMPREGWWGFAALLDGEKKMQGPDGAPVDVELGGLIWVYTRDMK